MSPWIRSLAALLALAACESTRTQLVVVVDSDVEMPVPLAAFRTRVRGAGGAEDVREFPIGDADGGTTLPASFGVAPRGGDATRSVTIEAEGLDPGGQRIVTARARTSFVEGHRMRLDLFLSRSCLYVECDPDETCRDGACVTADVPEGSLEEWNGVLGTRDAGAPAEDAGPPPSWSELVAWSDDLVTTEDGSLDSRGRVVLVGRVDGQMEVAGAAAPYETPIGTTAGIVLRIDPTSPEPVALTTLGSATGRTMLTALAIGPDDELWVAGRHDGVDGESVLGGWPLSDNTVLFVAKVASLEPFEAEWLTSLGSPDGRSMFHGIAADDGGNVVAVGVRFGEVVADVPLGAPGDAEGTGLAVMFDAAGTATCHVDIAGTGTSEVADVERAGDRWLVAGTMAGDLEVGEQAFIRSAGRNDAWFATVDDRCIPDPPVQEYGDFGSSVRAVQKDPGVLFVGTATASDELIVWGSSDVFVAFEDFERTTMLLGGAGLDQVEYVASPVDDSLWIGGSWSGADGTELPFPVAWRLPLDGGDPVTLPLTTDPAGGAVDFVAQTPGAPGVWVAGHTYGEPGALTECGDLGPIAARGTSVNVFACRMPW